jgi:hypothetical protein
VNQRARALLHHLQARRLECRHSDLAGQGAVVSVLPLDTARLGQYCTTVSGYLSQQKVETLGVPQMEQNLNCTI